MVTGERSQKQENATGNERRDNSCFAVKPVGEQTNDWEQLINKVNLILESLNISVSRYENELNDL